MRKAAALIERSASRGFENFIRRNCPGDEPAPLVGAPRWPIIPAVLLMTSRFLARWMRIRRTAAADDLLNI